MCTCNLMTIQLYVRTPNIRCSVVAASPTAASQQVPLSSQPPTVGGAKLDSGSSSSLKSGAGSTGDANNKTANDRAGGQRQREGQEQADEGRDSTSVVVPGSSGGDEEEPTASIFLQTSAYLLDVHALKVQCILLWATVDRKFLPHNFFFT